MYRKQLPESATTGVAPYGLHEAARHGHGNVTGLAMRMKYMAGATLQAEIHTAIGQRRHDVDRRRRHERQIVAGEHDPPALLTG